MANPFSEIITNFENSMRGRSKVNNIYVKAFPHTAGSVFISKIVSLLKTIINDKNVYANLGETVVRERIYRNGKALVISEVLDETVKLDNMILIFESFQNISIDSYAGMKLQGKYGELQKSLTMDEEEDLTDEELIE